MANNRLYIRDRATGRRFYLARTMGTRWLLSCSAAELQSWLDGFDRIGDEHVRSAPTDVDALQDDGEVSQLEFFDDKTEADDSVWPCAKLPGLTLAGDVATLRLRRALSDFFAVAQLDDGVDQLATVVLRDLVPEHARIAKNRIMLSQQETQPLSTDDARSSAESQRRDVELAPRSGALEPEEITDGPHRRPR